MLEEARMQREERVFTNACVNYIVPLAILGLVANFIPYLMIVVPVEEEDVCWFYFLTRSPYQLDYVENWLYYTAKYARFFIIGIELSYLGYTVHKINQRKLDFGQINISLESKLITTQWIIFSIVLVFFKILIPLSSQTIANVLEWLMFISH